MPARLSLRALTLALALCLPAGAEGPPQADAAATAPESTPGSQKRSAGAPGPHRSEERAPADAGDAALGAERNGATPAEIAVSTPAPPAPKPSSPFPVFLSLHPDIHEYRAFADGGWDGNWYVGYNTCWIVKLPKAPAGPWAKAFLGARLGRAKTRPRPGGKPWDKDVLPGKVYVAVSSFPAFGPEASFFLADTRDIPVEPDDENPSLGAGHAEWFWTEVPLRQIGFDSPNYLAAWSPTNTMLSVSSAPILAAAMGSDGESRAWLDNAIQGSPPREAKGSTGVPVSFYLPSLVVKLVPQNAGRVAVRALELSSASETLLGVRFSAQGENVEAAWVEGSADGFGWERISPYRRHPPYSFAIDTTKLDSAYRNTGMLHLRGAAQDMLGNQGISDAVQMPLNPAP